MIAAELGKALLAVDAALAQAPQRNGQAFAEALGPLTASRKALYARDGRAGAAERSRLDRLNGIISIVLSGQFPLGEPVWDEIRKMRGWLAALQVELAEAELLAASQRSRSEAPPERQL